jgi:hypothetical protein
VNGDILHHGVFAIKEPKLIIGCPARMPNLFAEKEGPAAHPKAIGLRGCQKKPPNLFFKLQIHHFVGIHHQDPIVLGLRDSEGSLPGETLPRVKKDPNPELSSDL